MNRRVRLTAGLGPAALELEQQEYSDKNEKGWTKPFDEIDK